jgi:hypothetical protein
MSRDSELLIGRAEGQTYYRENASENYVTIPPAFLITDTNGATWTLGSEYIHTGRDWAFYFNVRRNDVDTGEYAARIEYRNKQVRIWTKDGWKVWHERKRGSLSQAPGYWL